MPLLPADAEKTELTTSARSVSPSTAAREPASNPAGKAAPNNAAVGGTAPGEGDGGGGDGGEVGQYGESPLGSAELRSCRSPGGDFGGSALPWGEA